MRKKTKYGKINALESPKMVFCGPKSPPQAEIFENPKSINDYSPLVIGRFVTRGGIVVKISPDTCHGKVLSYRLYNFLNRKLTK